MRKLFILGSFYVAVLKRVVEMRRASKKTTYFQEVEPRFQYTENDLPTLVEVR